VEILELVLEGKYAKRPGVLSLSLIQAPNRMRNMEGMGFAVICPTTLERGFQMCSV